MATDLGRLVATLGLNTAPFMASMNQANSKMAKFGKFAQITGRTFTRFITLPMALAGGAALSTQKDFETALTKIIGLVGVSRDQVEAWKKSVLGMSGITGKGPVELADALYFVTSAGIRGAEAMEVLEMSAKASAAGLGETKVIADLVTSAMNAYGKENLNAAQATDILVAAVREGKAEADELAGAMGMVLPIASEFGVTFDQVGAAFAGMTRTGTNARVAGTQLKAILSAMASPSQLTADALAEVGLNAETFRRTIREEGLIKALLDLRKATIGNEEAMSRIFPNIRALMGVLDLLGANVEYNVQIFEALKNSAGSLERAFEEVGGTTQQKLNVALSRMRVVGVQLGEVYKPFATKVLTLVSDALNKMSHNLEGATEAQRKLRIGLNLATAALGPFLLILSRVIQMFMVNPIGAVITAFIALGMVIAKLAVNMQTAAKVERQAQKQREHITNGINKEVVSIRTLFYQLDRATKGSEEWNKIKEKINSKYGEYLKNLDIEKATTEDLADAVERVVRGKRAEMELEGYGKEIERLGKESEDIFDKIFKNMNRRVKRHSEELLEGAAPKLPVDFMLDVNLGISEASETGFKHKAVEIANNIYDKWSDALAGKDFLGVPFSGYSKKDFAESFIDAVAIQQQINKAVKIAEDRLAEAEAELGELGVTVSIETSIENIDKQISATKKVKDAMSKTVYLEQMVAFYAGKVAILKKAQGTEYADLLNATEKEVGHYQKLLIEQKAIESSLGAVGFLEGKISALLEDRKFAKKEELTANSRSLANAEMELEILELQTSALNELERRRGMINVAEKKSQYLSDEAYKSSLAEIRLARATLNIDALKAAGVNKLAILEQELINLKNETAFKDEKAAKIHDKDVLNKEREIRAEKLRIMGAGTMLLLEEKRNNLIEDRERAGTLDEAQQIQITIDQIEKEIRKEQAYIDSLGEEAKIRYELNELQIAAQKLSGEAYYDNLAKQRALQNELILRGYIADGYGLEEQAMYKLMLAEQDLANATADNIEERAKAVELAKLELATIREQVEVLKDPLGVVEGSREWFEFYRERKKLLLEYQKDEKTRSLANAQELLEIDKKTLNKRLTLYSEVLSGVQNFASSIQNVLSAQMNKELEAAGNNKRKRMAIEKKYHEKMKKWAIGQALIDGALAIMEILKVWAANPVMAAILIAGSAATTAAQMAVINAQGFAKGGKVKSGKELAGPAINGDNTIALVQPGEVILNKVQQKAIGGPKALAEAGVPGFAGGGGVGIPSTMGNFQTITEEMFERIFSSLKEREKEKEKSVSLYNYYDSEWFLYGDTMLKKLKKFLPNVRFDPDSLKDVSNTFVDAANQLDFINAPTDYSFGGGRGGERGGDSGGGTVPNVIPVVTPVITGGGLYPRVPTGDENGVPLPPHPIVPIPPAPPIPPTPVIPTIHTLPISTTNPEIEELINNISLASGGLVYGETLVRAGEYPNVKANPEVIAPLSDIKKMFRRDISGSLPQTIELVARGKDLYAVINTEGLLRNTY